MTTYFFLMVDGSVFKSSADSKTAAINEVEKFYDGEFMDDLNLIEWKNTEYRFIQDLTRKSTATFPVDTPYQLEGLLKIKKTRKPKEIKEEWEEDFDE